MFNFPYHGSHWRPRMHTVVVSIDGPCTKNDSSDPDSRAAWSIYFGPHSPKNDYGLVSVREPQTNSRAALEAVRRVIMKVRSMRSQGEFDNPYNPFKEIIIRTTSQYIVNTFHTWVWEYQSNGWQKSQGGSIAHPDVIREIHSLICDCETNMNMAIRFWHAERDGEAEALAKRALRGEDDSGYCDE